MPSDPLLTQKISPGKAAILLLVLAVPGYFWFSYLYQQYVVLPGQVSPAMQKMRDSMLQHTQKPAPAKLPLAGKEKPAVSVGKPVKGG